MPDHEDTRQAAGMAIGVSNQVMAASLAMLAILGAALLFIMDKRSITWYGLIVILLSFLSFVVSVFLGAKGVAKVYKEGHEGKWHYLNGDPQFQYQALTVILGVILFPIGIFLMGKPPEPVPSSDTISRLQHSIDSLMGLNARNDLQVQELTRIVDSLKGKHSADSTQKRTSVR